MIRNFNALSYNNICLSLYQIFIYEKINVIWHLYPPVYVIIEMHYIERHEYIPVCSPYYYKYDYMITAWQEGRYVYVYCIYIIFSLPFYTRDGNMVIFFIFFPPIGNLADLVIRNVKSIEKKPLRDRFTRNFWHGWNIINEPVKPYRCSVTLYLYADVFLLSFRPPTFAK